jgi:hypothetical protein
VSRARVLVVRPEPSRPLGAFYRNLGLTMLATHLAVVLPVTADPHRAGEQHANAAAVAHLPGMFTRRDWRDPGALFGSVLRALGAAARGTRSTGQRGNAAAAALARELVPAVSPADRGGVL